MKNLLKIFLLLLLANAAMAQSPQGTSYQAIARSSTGAILASQPIGLRFSIHDGSATGTVVYQETFNITTTPLGLFSVTVGTGTPVSGTFSGINWGANAKYLQVEMDAAGGTSYAGMGTAQQMMSVPYALYSNNGVPAGTTTGDMLYWNGSAWVRVPAGTPGQVLTVNPSGVPAWSNVLLASVSTDAISSVTGSSATGGGNVISAGGSSVIAYGVCWSTTPGTESVTGAHSSDGSGLGSFMSSITGLAGGTTYYVRAYATNVLGTAYGNEVSFTTNSLPTVSTASIGSITTSSAVGGGNVTATGGSSVTAFGVCWSTTAGAESVSGAHTTDGSGTGAFTSNLTGLTAGATYYVKAYATNGVGTAYGSEVSFTTVAIVVPALTTASASSITSSGATSGGDVTSDGGATVTARGVCWSTTAGAESISGSHTTDGTGTGIYSSSITGLTPGITYYVKAYATNSAGTAYGTEVSFTTNAVVATLTTTSAGSVTSTSAASGGNISSDGGATITARGVCWSTTAGAESTAGSHTTDGTGTGSFASIISGLTPGVTYYVMAYATNSAGTAYGSEVSFTTNAVAPSLTTTGASSITSSSANSGGNVTSDGGAAVTAYGVCWSTTAGAESVSGTHTTDGAGTGSFTSSISGLAPGVTYYVMAYATNSAGTAYGSEVSFTTNTVVATLTTTSASSITSTSAGSGGNISSDGGAAVTARGVCWSTTAGAESTSGTHTTDGAGTGSFTSSITGLTAGTTYYVKAYATNSAGTAYGSEVTFTTDAVPATLTTSTTGSITTSGATSGGNISSDGGAAVTARGVCWSTTAGAESISGSHTSDGTGTGSFTSTISGLSAGTTYYVMAYATNSAGTAYGSEVSFTTNAIVIPTLTTTTASSITSSGATSGGNVTSDGGAAVTARGVCWSTTAGAESVSGSHTTDGAGTGSFTSTISGLSTSTTYYVMAYATNSAGTAYGSEVSFTTSASLLPAVTTGSVTGITSTSFTPSGTVTSIGGSAVTDRGFVGGFSPGLTLGTGYVIPVGSGLGSYDTTITHVPGSSTLYIKAYATNSSGTTYGSEVSFTTLPPVPATVTTDSVDTITSNSAVAFGTVTDNGGDTVINSGFCWSTTSGSESISGAHTSDHGENFRSHITGLSSGTTYYIKGYATTAMGTSYGGEISFTTVASSLPVVVTNSADGITSSTATLHGDVTSEGGSPVTARGFMGSFTPGGELTSGLTAPAGSGAGSFSFDIPHFTASTTLYYITYATNSFGTTYGSEMSFTSLPATLPTVSTNPVSSIAGTTAQGNGTLISDGGASITDEGICWSTTSGAESIAGAHSGGGGGSGTFNRFMSGLTANTTYYVMAYAVNSVGTVYGSEVSFTTTAVDVSTATPSSITTTGAFSGGFISSSVTVTARGVCWSSTSGTESVSGSHTTDGSGTGGFGSTITGLTPGATYYVKAYATWGGGTVYGNEYSFTTAATVTTPTVVADSVYGVAGVSAYCDFRITSTGGATITASGVAWSTTSGGESASGPHVSSGGITVFITSLSYSTTYYLKAYATNSAGTTYGNEIIFTTGPSGIAIGNSFGGGIIFYILQPGDAGYDATTPHGLIASNFLLSSNTWYNGANTTTGATGTAIGTGLANTDAIIASQGSAGCGCYAATVARSYTGGGFTDWYLPSKDELHQLDLHRFQLSIFGNPSYWSSSESSNSNAWLEIMGSSQTSISKSGANFVRAVRSF